MIRAIMSVPILVVTGGALWFGAQTAEKYFLEDKRKLEKLEQDLEKERAEKERFAIANRLLKVDHLMAYVQLHDTYTKPDGTLISIVKFWEADNQGRVLGDVREFHVSGDEVHIEGLVVKFKDELVEKADPLRGGALYAFRSIHGSKTAPADAHPLHSRRTRPGAYGQSQHEYEKQIWNQFWDIANDPQKMEQFGIRAAHGIGASMQLRKGQRYRVKLRSTGQVTIEPDEMPVISRVW